jgi:hypothetical protein
MTLVNNEQNSNTCQYGAGGGIYINYNATVTITSCIIRNCLSYYGGGIGISAGSSVFLSNTNIYNNRALVYGGGINTGSINQLVFDTENLCSVYNNFASRGMDILINFVSYNPTVFQINLAIGSIVMSEPDNYFLVCHNAEMAVNTAEGYLQQTDADIYVSPFGSDNNSGLTEAAPMRTIALAMQKIKSNLDNPHTLHLASGTYSYSSNGQILPFAIKSDVRLIGSGTETTILDGELTTAFIGGESADRFHISDIGFINCRFDANGPIDLVFCHEFQLNNLFFTNCSGHSMAGVHLTECTSGILDNLVIAQISMNKDISGLFLFECDNIYINKVLLYEQHILTADYSNLGITIFDSDVVFRNSILANNTAVDAFLFSYQNVYANYTDYNLDMSNVLFMNNTVSNLGWVYCPIYMQNRFQPIQVNNVTIANNTTNTTLTRIFGYADIKNLISHNPGSPGELYLRNNLSTVGVQAEVSISNSLFRSNSVNADLPNLVTFNECIFGSNPLFLGATTDTLSVTQPEYYYLSEGSPCINTGVADRTCP